MKMMRVLAALVAITLATPAFAEVSTMGLTKEQAALLEQQRAQFEVQNVQGKSTSTKDKVAEVNEWVQVGAGVGKGLASAARELGLVANEFARTPVGQITIGLIIWKVAGGDIVQLLFGLLWMMTAGGTWFYFYRKLWAPTLVTTEYYESGKRKSVVKKQPTPDADTMGWRCAGAVAGLIVAGAGIWITFA